MLRIAICNVCKKEYPTKRSHSKTCNSTCRNVRWRLSKAKVVSVKIDFNTNHYRQLHKQADANNMTVTAYIVNALDQ